MKCDEIRELISCMLDNELNAEDSAKVRAHVAGCPECMRVFEAFTAISLSLSDMEEVPQGFTEDVMHKVHRTTARKKQQQKKQIRKQKLRFVRTAAMAACVALVVLAGTQLGNISLYTGNGDSQVADTVRTVQNGDTVSVTPVPTREPTLFEEIFGSQPTPAPNDGLSTMSLDGDEEGTTTEEVVVVTPTVTPTPAPTPTPMPLPNVTPTPIPEMALSLPEDLLIVMESAAPGKFTDDTALTMTVQGNDLYLWIDSGRIYCENRTAGTAYYTIGTADALQRMVGLPIPSPVVLPQ